MTAAFLTHGLQGMLNDLTSGAVDLGKYAVLKDLLVVALTSALELVRRYLRNYP